MIGMATAARLRLGPRTIAAQASAISERVQDGLLPKDSIKCSGNGEGMRPELVVVVATNSAVSGVHADHRGIALR